MGTAKQTKKREPAKKVLNENLQKRKVGLEKLGWQIDIESMVAGKQFFGDKFISTVQGNTVTRLLEAAEEAEKERIEESLKVEFEVEPSRLSDDGDIAKSLSVQSICEKQTVKKPFEFNGEQYVGTGAVGTGTGYGWSEFFAYKIIPRETFTGETFTYYSKPNGQGYHGIIVKYLKQEFVLVGPEITFIPEQIKKPSQISEENGNAKLGQPNSGDIIHNFDLDQLVQSTMPTQQRRQERLQKDKKSFIAGLESLGNSIVETDGVIEPIVVRPRRDLAHKDKKDIYEIVVGWRRWMASKHKNLDSIKCFVRDLTDAQILAWQYDENHERKENNPLDDAYTFKVFVEKENYTFEMLADRFNKKLREVKEILSLNNLIPEAVKQFEEGDLPLKHAVYISTFPPETQNEIVENGYAYKWSDIEDGAASFKEFKEEVADNIIRRLEDAPFDTENPVLHESAKGLKCSQCPNRSSVEPLLFPELQKEDSCLIPQCWDFKSKVHLKLERERIAEKQKVESEKSVSKQVKDVPLVTERSWVEKEKIPFKEKVLTDQKLLDAPECENSVLGLAVEGAKKGQQVYICQDKNCPVHNLKKEETSAETEKAEAELNTQNEKRVRNETRHRIMSKAVETFDDYTTFWQFDDLIQELIFQRFFFGDDYAAECVISIMKGVPKGVCKDSTKCKKWIASLSKKEQSQMLFLLTFKMEGLYSHQPIEGLQKLALDYARRDYSEFEAEVRLELEGKK